MILSHHKILKTWGGGGGGYGRQASPCGNSGTGIQGPSALLGAMIEK